MTTGIIQEALYRQFLIKKLKTQKVFIVLFVNILAEGFKNNQTLCFRQILEQRISM